jgi:uncharacterized coiled-coil protein SlyX
MAKELEQLLSEQNATIDRLQDYVRLIEKVSENSAKLDRIIELLTKGMSPEEVAAVLKKITKSADRLDEIAKPETN